ncbi:MAG: serine/threonine protein phosphatase [Ruminococcaceae bacterium]|nr:serine/threonine protein phosphatase [Oscillospiraceae bacterium]
MGARRSPIRPQRTRPARIERLALPAGRRILFVSDVHGNLPYLRGLLEKAAFSPADILILAGDLLEKGRQSLDTLRYVTALSKTHTVYAVSGNCDWWIPLMYEVGTVEDNLWYINNKPFCLARQMCAELGIAVSPDMDYPAMRDALAAHYPEEFAFLRAMPEVLDTPGFTVVHGGLPEGPPERWDGWACMKYDHFLTTPRRFDKWVIVGHWPVVLYHENIVDANPIIDREKRIASIDGGCVLKDDGQLNALILPDARSEDFSFLAYDPFPLARVLADQNEGARSYYIRWGDAQVRVLQRGAEFSRVRHLRTGYEMDVLTRYLYDDNGARSECAINDSTDYVLPLRAGDTVSVVEETSRGFLVKHNGVSGWYYGPLQKL